MSGRGILACCGSVAMAVVLGGCVMSIEPVVAGPDATFDARLVGEWEEVGGSDRAVVTRGTGDTYLIDYTDGETGRFEGRLGRLGDRWILDVSPAPRDGEVSEPYKEMLIPAHMIFAIDIATDTVRMAGIVGDSLVAALRTGRLRLAHARIGDRLVLQGTTAELRAALGPLLARPGMVEPPSAFRRARRAP